MMDLRNLAWSSTLFLCYLISLILLLKCVEESLLCCYRVKEKTPKHWFRIMPNIKPHWQRPLEARSITRWEEERIFLLLTQYASCWNENGWFQKPAAHSGAADFWQLQHRLSSPDTIASSAVQACGSGMGEQAASDFCMSPLLPLLPPDPFQPHFAFPALATPMRVPCMKKCTVFLFSWLDLIDTGGRPEILFWTW